MALDNPRRDGQTDAQSRAVIVGMQVLKRFEKLVLVLGIETPAIDLWVLLSD